MRWSVRPEAYIITIAVLGVLVSCVALAEGRTRHERRVRAFRTHGAVLVQQWMRGDAERTSEWSERFLARHDVARGVPFAIEGAVRGRVIGSSQPEPWSFVEAFPGGVDRLDAETRLALETGNAPVELAGVEERARVFAALWRHPDLHRLRTAPLPVESKLFLARRAPRSPAWDDARRLLQLLQRCVYDETAPLGTLEQGYRLYGDTVAVAPGAGRDHYLYTPPTTPPAGLSLVAEDGRFRLRYHGPSAAAPAADAVWAGTLVAPLAGTWSVQDLGYRPGLWWMPAMGGLVLLGAAYLAVRRQRREGRARAEFITELAHDLRTPVTALRMHAELFASGRAPAGAEQRYAETIARESERLSGLLGNLLDLSRLERGAAQLHRAPARLRDVVDGAASSFRTVYPDRNGDLELAGDDAILVKTNPIALERCLVNLLENAGKYTPHGTRIRVAWDRVSVAVADAGPGVPRRERKRLFARYARGQRARRDAVPGTGLGLALVHALMDAMGGSVQLVDSEKGAHFVLYLEKEKAWARTAS